MSKFLDEYNEELEKQKRLIAQRNNAVMYHPNEVKVTPPKDVSTNALKGFGASFVSGLKEAPLQGAVGAGSALMGYIGENQLQYVKNMRAMADNSPYAAEEDKQKWRRMEFELEHGINAINNEQMRVVEESQKRQQAVDDKYQLGTVGEFMQDTGSALGGMTGSLALGLANPTLGLASFGAQAGGMGYNQAMQEGASMADARKYGIATGVMEAGIERATGGLGKFFGKGLDDVILGKLGKEIANTTKKGVALNTARGALGEAGEEMVATALDPVLQRATYNEDAENASARDILYSGAVGGVLGGALGGGVNVLDYGFNARAQAQKQMPPQKQNGTSNDAKTEIGTNTKAVNNEALKPKLENVHIGQRTYDDFANKEVNAFQYDNPQLKTHIQGMAESFRNDLQNSTKGERGVIRDKDGSVTGNYGIKRSTTAPIEQLLDDSKLSYDKIGKALDDIIVDEGRENNRNAKLVESYLDDALSNGYTNIYGDDVPIDYEYLDKKSTIPGALPNVLYPSNEDLELLLQQQEQADADAVNLEETLKVQEPNAVINPATQMSPQKEKAVKTYVDLALNKLDLRKVYEEMPDNRNMYIQGDTVHINKNKLNAYDGLTIKRILAHEIYHSIEQTEEGRRIYELALEVAGDGAVQNKIAEYKAEGIDLDEIGAKAEIGADFIEKAMTDEKTIDRILLEDRTLAQRIFTYIKDAIAILNAKRTRTKEEAEELVRLIKARRKYEEALAKVQKGEYEAGFYGGKDGEVRTQSKGLFADTPAQSASVEVRNSIRSLRHDTSEGKMREDLITKGGMSKSEADAYIKNLNKLADHIESFQSAFLDSFEEYGKEDRVTLPYKDNSDPLYKISLDFSTLCKKRIITQALIESLQVKRGKALSAEEQIAIRDYLKELKETNDKIEVACAMCYVEAARLRTPKWINQFIENPTAVVQKYLSTKNPANKQAIKDAGIAKRRELGYDDKATLKDIKAKSVEDWKVVKGAQDAVKENYKSTDPEELKVLEFLKNDFKKEMVLTASGMMELKQKQPTVYTAFNAYLAGKAKSKALQTSEPYYYGDSSVVSDELIEQMNEENGLRHNSWSDFEMLHLLDLLVAVTELSVRKAKMHYYSKVPAEFRVLKNTNAMGNISLVPRGATGLDEKGNLDFDPVEGVDFDEAKKLRRECSKTAGTVAIGINDAQITALLDSDDIDYVIPYHTSGLSKLLRKMVGIEGWQDYQDYQNEKKGNKNASEPIKFSEWFHPTKEDIATKSGIEIMREAQAEYLRLCKERGLKPKFSNTKEGTDFTTNENYWKLLVDRKMIDNITKKIIIQEAVKPSFDFEYLTDLVTKQSTNSMQESVNAGVEAVEKWDAEGGLETRVKQLQKQKKEGQSRYNTTRYDELVDEYGAMDKGMQPRVDIDVPKQTTEENKTRKFTRTALEADTVDDDTKDRIIEDLANEIENGTFTYVAESNAEQQKQARETIKEDGYLGAMQGVVNNFNEGKAITSKDIAIAEQLIMQASAKGDVDSAYNLIGMLAIIGTEQGRSIQALSMLKKLAPEGRLMQMQNLAKRISRQYDLTDERKIIIPKKLANKMLNQKTIEGMDAVQAEIIQSIAEQTPATFWDKVNAWRYLAMLGNVRTHMRNIMGNGMHLALRRTKDELAGLTEFAFLKEGERTKTIGKINKEYRKFAEQNFNEEGKNLITNASKYSDMTEVEMAKRVFGKTDRNLIEKARKFNMELMEAEDMLFKKNEYIYAMARYMQANKITPKMIEENAKLKKKVQEYAVTEARIATFQEANEIASMLSRFESQKNVSKGKKAAQIAVGAVLPFKRTPLNILKRGFEYSPAGLIKAVTTDLAAVKKGKMTANEMIDHLSMGMTGSMIFLLGYFMASFGLLNLGYDEENKRKQNYENQLGEQNYALVLPDGSTYTIDWAAPAVMPLFVGASFYKELKEKDQETNFLNALIRTSINVVDPIMEMSMMDGLQNALSSYASGTSESITDYGANILTGYLGQFIPTLFGQMARTIDDTRRSTYAPSNSPFTPSAERFARQSANKTPVASMVSEPNIDVWGRERKQEGGNVAIRGALQMVSPGTYASNKETPLDKEILRLYDELGESKVIPKSIEKYYKYQDKTYTLSAKDYTEMQKYVGSRNFGELSVLINNPYYKTMNDEERIDAIAEVYEYNNYQGKKKYLTKKGVSFEDDTMENKSANLKSCGSWSNYFKTKNGIADIKEANSSIEKASSKSDANKKQIAKLLSETKGLSNEQRQEIWANMGGYDGKNSDTYKEIAMKYGYWKR